eukprot:gene11909-15933_t
MSEDRKCGNTNCSNLGKHLCSGCGEEIYCSKDCQKSHWQTHKPRCQSATKPEAVAFMKSFDSLSIKQLKNIMKAKAATMEGKKREITLRKLDQIVEKPALVKFVQEFVTLSEVESLLSAHSTTAVNDTSSSSKPTKKKSNSSTPALTPDQLRQNAAMMRRDPAMVRRSQPAFANMTDEQIKQYADQLEQAAADPAMMKEVERMAKLSSEDRTDLQNIQEGLTGIKPIDTAWIDNTIATLKRKPKMFKDMMKGKGAMLGGISDEQINSFIDVASKMEASTLKIIISGIRFLASLYKPGVDLYNVIDKYTFGMAKYIAMAVVALISYYLFYGLWLLLKLLFTALFYFGKQLYAIIYPSAAGSFTQTAVGKAPEKAATATVGVTVGLEAAKSVGKDSKPTVVLSSDSTNTKKSSDDEFEF